MYIKVKKKKIDFSFFNCIITNTKSKMSNTKQELINLLGKSKVYHKYDDKAFGTSAEEFFKKNGYKNLEFILYLEEPNENIDYYECYGGSEAFHKIIKEGNLHFEWWDSCIGHLYLEEEEEEKDMKTISWVKENEKMIDFTMTQEEWEAQEEECLSDTDYDTDDLPNDSDEEEEEEEKELPEDLKEWVLENMKAVEEHTLEEDKAMLFIKFLEENQHNPIFIKLYDEYEKSKN